MKRLYIFFLATAHVFLFSGCTSNVEMAKENLKTGMTHTQVEEIMGMPDDVQESNGREDWIYIGGGWDDFKNIRVVFIKGKYARWLPAGRNTAGEAAFGDALMYNANSINQMNQTMQMNQMNNSLNSINNTMQMNSLRSY